jgi:hypothetical protein
MKGNEELEQFLSEYGREVFQGKCVGGGTKGEDESEEKKTRKGRTIRSKGWWNQNAGNMTCWAHKESAAVDEETKKNMETAWEAENDKDECIVILEGPERTTGWEAKQRSWGAIGSAE